MEPKVICSAQVLNYSGQLIYEYEQRELSEGWTFEVREVDMDLVDDRGKMLYHIPRASIRFKIVEVNG